MAVIWQRKTKTGNYQVRTAGSTVRLYKDGVFHSHYNPRQIVTRGVWDLLVLPALMYPPGTIHKVLLLGLGGGAAVHLLNHFVKPESILALELDPVHISVAKRFFKADYDNTTIQQIDAIEWVRREAALKTPAHFDLIIDDLYGEHGGEPVRAVEANKEWADSLCSLLAPNGMLVSNFVTRKEIFGSSYVQDTATRKIFKRSYVFRNRHYQNEVGAFLKRDCARQQLRENISLHPPLRRKHYRSTFSVRRL